MKFSFERYALAPEAVKTQITDLLNTLHLKRIGDDVLKVQVLTMLGLECLVGKYLPKRCLLVLTH